ncbi:glycosyltransferase [Thalassotalea ponticola]|uniref:glycosyltransferase n=1 Tax=Thalassotalea ponticola TaxID=1523392 RepID=UPI0025B6045C|nr:glycosyltransferase [Thalassotalea ponticola]MDN3652653.1 glycosyltransferase [Thalassotalea ponticola]
MKKKILITNYDMEIGGVERSLISMLNNFDHDNYDVDLHLHSHSGPLLDLLSDKVNLLKELETCKTFRMSIVNVFRRGYPILAIKRLFAKVSSLRYRVLSRSKDSGYYQAQKIWEKSITNIDSLNAEYDVAISYLWPHHFTAFNVDARVKIAWIHTDYSTIDVDVEKDLAIWKKFDYIISISDACSIAFIETYPELKDKLVMVENITSPNFIRDMAQKGETPELKPDYFNIVSTGRLCEQKAFDKAVEALRLIRNMGYDKIRWYIIGEGGERENIETLINEYKLNNDFILLGSKINPYPYMNNADLYVQPSRYEGKAVTIAEAKILAKPILITNYPTSSSQLTHGIDGEICEQNVESIAQSVIQFYQNKNIGLKYSNYCQKQNYSNSEELDKLYSIFQ